LQEAFKRGSVPYMLDLFLSSLPSLRVLLTVAPIAILYISAVAWLVGYLKARRNVRTAYTRKIFHFLIFTAVSIVHMIWHLPGVTVFGIVSTFVVIYAVQRGDGFAFYEALARPADAPHRTLFIIVPLVTTALGGIATNSFFAAYAYVGYLVCGWGDAVGEPVGSRWGKHQYRVPSLAGVKAHRSFEGSTAVFLSGSIAAIIGLLGAGLLAPSAIAVGFACGAAGALVEAVSTHGLDNFTTQLAAAAVATLLL
jgi:phytol kinase